MFNLHRLHSLKITATLPINISRLRKIRLNGYELKKATEMLVYSLLPHASHGWQ